MIVVELSLSLSFLFFVACMWPSRGLLSTVDQRGCLIFPSTSMGLSVRHAWQPVTVKKHTWGVAELWLFLFEMAWLLTPTS